MDFQQPKPGKQLKTLLNITRYWRVVLSHCQGGVVVSICASHHNDLDSIPAWGICGVSFWLIPNDSMGFSLGTPAFLLPQNQLTANTNWPYEKLESRDYRISWSANFENSAVFVMLIAKFCNFIFLLSLQYLKSHLKNLTIFLISSFPFISDIKDEKMGLCL